MEIDQYMVAADQQLVELSLQGDSRAFEQLFNRYRDAIHQLYMQRTGGNADDADDLQQETFIKVFLNLHKYNPAYTFGQWIYVIARNTFVDYIRRRRNEMQTIDRNNDSPQDYSTPDNLTPEESMITNQNRDQMAVLMGLLTPRYRLLIELRFFREFSYEEIAVELSLPMGTVKTQIHRAREQLCALILRSSDPLRKL